MKTLLTLASLIGSSAFAGTPAYQLAMDLSLGGKIVSHPKVVVAPNKTAMISQKDGDEETFIEVTANEGTIAGHSGIIMKFSIGTIAKDGKRKVVSNPSVLAEENSPATLTIEKGKLGTQELSLSVVAKKATL